MIKIKVVATIAVFLTALFAVIATTMLVTGPTLAAEGATAVPPEVVGFGLLVFILHLVRTNRLHVGYAVLWFLPLIMMMITVSCPPLLNFITGAVGAIFPASALSMLAFMFIFLVLVFISIQLTTLSNRQIELIQHLALTELSDKEKVPETQEARSNS